MDSEAFLATDPRMELIAAVEALACGNPCPEKEKSRYLDRVTRRFKGKHAAVDLFAAMTPTDWRHRHPSLIMLDFSAPPELEVDAYQDHYSNQGRADALSRLLPALRDFAHQTDFMGFYASEQRFYHAILNAIRKPFETLGYLKPISDYLGPLPRHRYHFLFSPLYHGPTKHNLLYKRPDDSFDIYSISGHSGLLSGEARLAFQARGMLATAWHEVAHTLIDPITQKHGEALLRCSGLYGLMTGIARSRYQGPEGWLHMVDEHVIRAMTCRLAARAWGESAGRRALESERKSGFQLVGPLYELLLEYEAQRRRYRTIAAFYPRVVETFTRLFEELKGKLPWTSASR